MDFEVFFKFEIYLNIILRCPTCIENLWQDESHFAERHECIRLFTKIYGYNPLRYYLLDRFIFEICFIKIHPIPSRLHSLQNPTTGGQAEMLQICIIFMTCTYCLRVQFPAKLKLIAIFISDLKSTPFLNTLVLNIPNCKSFCSRLTFALT